MGTTYSASRLYELIALLVTSYFPLQANGCTYLWTFGNRRLNGLCKLLNRLLNQMY